MEPLPSSCFISHSYADADACDRLLRTLSGFTAPLVFEPIRAEPEEFVSKHLIDALLGCEGLIYLRGGASDRSFWVAFERDYALRAGRRVYSYDITSGAISQDRSRPLDLAVFASYARSDETKVRRVCDFMSRERHFDVWDDRQIRPGTVWLDEIDVGLNDRLARGGYVVAFWSRAACQSSWFAKEVSAAASRAGANRVLYAALEPCQPPPLTSQTYQSVVQIFGDAMHSETHRTDDLMVRLYWLIFRNSNL